MLKLGVICGGPSPERGVSLNSARSVMDHLDGYDIDIIPIFVDLDCKFYLLSKSQLYSNTPKDFDYKLNDLGTPLDAIDNIDIVFPAIHGVFGEDGQLQEKLETWGLPFVGTTSHACNLAMHKHRATQHMLANDLDAIENFVVTDANIQEFWKHHTRGIIKPSYGGSSIGVYIVDSEKETRQRWKELLEGHVYDEFVLEPYIKGREFTIVTVGDTILTPTEVQIIGSHDETFNYRRKYLPTANTFYHTPARFSKDTIETIKQKTQKIISIFNIQDFVRLDGWVLPDGRVVFTDLNPITGMEQNSFIFRQAALSGMTHREVLKKVLRSACKRYNLSIPNLSTPSTTNKHKVNVLFGGTTAEREVSLMSGTNVWLKLLNSNLYHPEPYFYDLNGNVWKLPYAYALNHTVEEIYENCKHSQSLQCITLDNFFEQSRAEKAFVFNALHGGEGEDGTIQAKMDAYGLQYNGSGPEASKVCMDKYKTGEVVNALNLPHVSSLGKYVLELDIMPSIKATWQYIKSSLEASHYIIKPRSEGCSAGIVKITSFEDFEKYIKLVQSGAHEVPSNTFQNQSTILELARDSNDIFILEPFVQTDTLCLFKNSLRHIFKTGWLELTVGILETEGHYHSLNPSITIAEGSVLSLEEKFQGGTGVNLTPPPHSLIDHHHLNFIKSSLENVAAGLRIQNYCRIDIFYNTLTEEIIVIEVNTLPALTPSTVLYHQALAENLPIKPLNFLEKLVQNKSKSLTPLAT